MEVTNGRKFIGRLPYHEDLLHSLENICNNEKVTLGVFYLIGAVSSAKLGYYDQKEKKVRRLRKPFRSEI